MPSRAKGHSSFTVTYKYLQWRKSSLKDDVFQYNNAITAKTAFHDYCDMDVILFYVGKICERIVGPHENHVRYILYISERK